MTGRPAAPAPPPGPTVGARRGDPGGFAPVGDARATYETHGTSLVRYLARRTAKTRLLLELRDLLPGDGRPGDPGRALAVFGVYCAAAAASFGHGYRQPSFDPSGTEIEERDLETGARVVARLDGRGPGSSLRLSVAADLEGIGRFEGREEILGTTVGLRGLGMPAPSRFAFTTVDPLAPWSATAVGTVTAELAPSLRGTLVRGHGTLDLADDRGHRGTVTLSRDGSIRAFDDRGTVLQERSIAR